MAKKNFELEMKVLERDNGGIFPALKRSIVPNYSFLIISYGGTGSDALSVIKENLERNIEKEQREKYIRLLAIDTCIDTQFTSAPVENQDGTVTMQPVKRFEDSEFFWLNNAPALTAVKLYKTDSTMQQWINPELPKTIQADPTKLDGSGASSTRQLGRLLLYPQQTVSALQTKITTLVGQITHGTANNLKVLIVTGISGGTGSGIVIDASYLIRSFINTMPGNIASRTEYCGFLLLPPTGTSDDYVNVSKGNRNGIAALKEIDHFMTIANRGEEYRMNFAGREVVSTEKIFKSCYLVDGVFAGMAVANPRIKANEVVSDCILDMMTSQANTTSAGVVMQTVDAFMSDSSAYTMEMVSKTTEHQAPRNANYVYCAIGHGKTLIPIELLRAYVAKEVFDAVYGKLQKSSVQEKDVSDFVKEVWTKPFNAKEQRSRIMSAVNACFGDLNRGPFFVVNLLKDVADYAGQQYKVVEQRALEMSKGLKLDNYANIQKAALSLNKQYFNTYVMVLEEMKKYLADQHEIICKSELLEKYGGSTYTFTPIDFGSGEAAASAVRDYLDGLVNMPKIKGQIARELLKEMTERREEWTQLETPDSTTYPKFNAAVRIRRFWQEQMDKLISATLEDFLIKYYAGDPDAGYEEIMTDQGMMPTPASAQYLQQAANAIVDNMWGSAGIAKPLAETNNILPDESFNAHYFFLVPQSAPHLRMAIENVLADRGIKDVIVNESYANDCLSCYSQFTGMPAYIFSWVYRAEPNYEESLKAAAIGLHMSETKGGERWQNYPNLLVEGIWNRLSNPPYDNPRERDIGRQAREVFDQACELGLTLKKALAVSANVGYYTIYTLPQAMRPDELLFKDVDTEKPDTPAFEAADERLKQAVEKKAQQLFGLANWADSKTLDKTDMRTALETQPKVSFVARELSFVNSVLTPDPAQPVPVGWEEKLAAELLRTSPQYMFETRGTVLVLERLFELIQKAQSAKLHCRAFAHFLAAGLFSYNEEYMQWIYQNGLEEVVLLDMDYGVDAQQYAKYYFLYQSFDQNFGYVFAALKDNYDKMISGADRKEIIQKTKQMKENAMGYLEEVNKAITPDKTNPNQTEILTTQAFRKTAEELGYDVAAIKAFYLDLKNELQFVPYPGF